MSRLISRSSRILFVSPNGVGVGHLMRLLAVARRASPEVEPVFLTMSQALRVARQAGFVAEYLPAKDYARTLTQEWHELLRFKVSALINLYRIDIVVFDGIWPFAGLRQAMFDHPNVPLVWCRRGMWKETVDHLDLDAPLPADLVVEPGELASSYDRGTTSRYRHQAHQVPPITYLSRGELLPREQARSELDLDPDATVALLQLGAGNIEEGGSTLEARVLELLGEREVDVIVARPTISNTEPSPEAPRQISIYPISRYLRAFDFAVAAAGYNTFHEVLLAGLPTGFAPAATAIDDQAARARWAQDEGVGFHIDAESPAEVDRVIESLLDPETRGDIERATSRITDLDGASVALEAILDLERSGRALHRSVEPPPPPDEPAAPARAAKAAETTGAFRRKWIRSVALRAYDKPRTRRLVALLPSLLRAWLRPILRRLDRGLAWREEARRPTRKARLHQGSILTEEEARSATRIGLLLVAETREELEEIVERVAQEQASARAFVPLLFTTVADLDVIRPYRLQFEYLVPPEDLARLAPEMPWSKYRDRRVARAKRVYGLTDVYPLAPATTEGRHGWSELARSFPK